MKEVKELIWKDNITELGKTENLFEIISNVKEIGLRYYIRNQKYSNQPVQGKYYFSCSYDDIMIECNSIDEAKEKAQEHFKQTIIKLFFKPMESKTMEQPKSRGCCSECGEGFDNEEEWKYNTECELCGHPIPEHLIIKRNEKI